MDEIRKNIATLKRHGDESSEASQKESMEAALNLLEIFLLNLNKLAGEK